MAKRKYYNGDQYILDEEKQILILKPDFHNYLLNTPKWGFKKFGGSSIGDIFETDNFKSQFAAFCHLARLKLPVLKTKYIKAGIAIEPKVFEALQSAFPNLEIKHIIAEEVGYDYFANKHEILGGVPDGLIPDKGIVLEIKTVGEAKKAYWDQGNVPEDYKKQAQLYAYLLDYNKFSIVAAFLKEEDYINPQNLDIYQRSIKTYPFIVNKNQVIDDINKIINFYKKYTRSGISPQYQLPRDSDQVAYLRCHNEQEWKELFESWKAMGKVDEDLNYEDF